MLVVVVFLILFSSYVSVSTIPDATKTSYFVGLLVALALYILFNIL